MLEAYRPAVDDCVQVWAKHLADGGTALLLVNWGPNATTVACDAACLAAAGVENATRARDVRAGTDLADVSAELDGEGGSRLLRVGGE